MTTGAIEIAVAVSLFAAPPTASWITPAETAHEAARHGGSVRPAGDAGEAPPGVEAAGLDGQGQGHGRTLRARLPVEDARARDTGPAERAPSRDAALIDPGPGPRDAQLRARIKEALTRNPDVRGYQIDVHVRHGTVYLQGRVGSPLEKRRANELARGIAGVRRVIDSLVAPTTWTWDQDWRPGSAPEDAARERAPEPAPGPTMR